ncbi:oligoendopeptidase, pepF/M3 family [Thermoactinomyces sp. DSM 45892]|nr:oligoendopeptidase, pepF/M3 family [Thermoactinomyces sp. DSM 45892]
MTMTQKYEMNWDLEVFFEGGSSSPTFMALLEQLKSEIPALKKELEKVKEEAGVEIWHDLLTRYQKLLSLTYQAYSFVDCLTSADVKDDKAKNLGGHVQAIHADLLAASTVLEAELAKMSDESFTALVSDAEIERIAFNLAEKRKASLDKMAPEMEELAGDLSVSGYHAWCDVYASVVGRMEIPFEEDGEEKKLSVGQLFTRFQSPDRAVRKDVFQRWEAAWENESELIALALNNLAGYRLALYKHRKWDSVLKEPLEMNRMSEETLTTMWETINQNKHRLTPFFERKAKMMGVEKLSWYDVDAPLPAGSSKVSYDEAAAFITEQFQQFNPQMAEFAKMNFKDRWIEAEDRPGKRPGGFMTDFPVNNKGESRIFMTFAGTPGCVSTLAHELGHGYHTYVMRDLPILAQRYAMNVAETASTFAEMIVIDAAITKATDREEKVALLAEKIQSAIAFCMNIHARFLFETKFYAARKNGPVSKDSLNELMEQAQKDAFINLLAEYHPTFWASKLHFYGTDVPFYNFPYTFGYLFSTGIYARALAEGSSFADKYDALLKDTASMSVEELASRHLGVDLTKPDFWQDALDLVAADVEEFLALTNE